MSSSPTADQGRAIRPRRRPAPPFGSIVCGVNGSRMDAEVAHQAALLAGPDTPLDIVAVAWEIGSGLSAQATLTAGHADRALARAAHIARATGASTSTRRVAAADTGAALLAEAADHDLLVLGAAPGRRFGGIAIGRPVTAALHRADSHVLVARPAPGEVPFPERILFADDGSPASDGAAALVAAIAGRHGAHVDLSSPPGMDAAARERVAAHAVAIVEAGAPDPALLDVVRGAHQAIPRLAREQGSTLVVVGSRRLSGPRALASVSERVAHDAPCSVLVARHPGRT